MVGNPQVVHYLLQAPILYPGCWPRGLTSGLYGSDCLVAQLSTDAGFRFLPVGGGRANRSDGVCWGLYVKKGVKSQAVV